MPNEQESPQQRETQKQARIQRRNVLTMGAGAFGFGLIAGNVFSADSAVQTARAGAADTFTTLQATDLITSKTPRVDVRAYGVVGDGQTDDTQALQMAVEAAIAEGVLYIPANLVVRITAPVTIDLSNNGNARYSFLGDGALRPETGASLHFQNASGYLSIQARVDGGSGNVDPPAGEKLNYSQDNAIRITNCTNGGSVGVWAQNYPGTVLSLEKNNPTFDIDDVRTFTCGRALYMGPGAGGKQWDFWGGFGVIRNIWEYNSIKCMTAEYVNDIEILHYENWIGDRQRGTSLPTKQGLLFESCNALWIDQMLVGGALAFPQVRVSNCHSISFGILFAPEAGADAFVFDSVGQGTINVILSGIKGTGITIDQTGYTTTTTLKLTVDLNEIGKEGVKITPKVNNDWIVLQGVVKKCGTAGTYNGVDIQTTKPVLLSNICVFDSTGNDLQVVTGNDTHVLDSRISKINGTPATVRLL